MTKVYGQQMKAPYERVAQVAPILPEWSDALLLDDGGTNPETLPAPPPFAFQVPVGYTFTVDEGEHESGHALKRVLDAALPAGRTGDAFMEARFDGTRTWAGQQAAADALPNGSNEQHQALPDEMWAEAMRSVAYGYFRGESTNSYGLELTPDRIARVRQAFEDLMEEAGVDVVKAYEFSANLDANGRMDRIGATAIALTEAQRLALGLVGGRAYTADMQRIWLAGTETTFPDTLASVYEDGAVAIGATGRWKISASARRDYGGVGRYKVRIAPQTAAVVT